MGSKVKLTLTCDEEQLYLIMAALEEYERLRIGQARVLADDLAGYWDRDINNLEFNKRAVLSDHLRKSFEEHINYALKATGKINKAKTDKVRSVEDLWMGLRYAVWTDLRTDEERKQLKHTIHGNGNKPLGYGEYPLADISMEYVER